MRKHNKRFAQRWARTKNEFGELDRSNFPQVMSHSYTKNKAAQLMHNSLLLSLLAVAGVRVPGAFMRKTG